MNVIPIINTLCGVNNHLVFSYKNPRFLFVANYNEMRSMPVLHHNCNNFITMRSRKSYIAFRRINDRFMALDRRNMLHSWDMTHGNYLGSITIDNEDLSDYVVWESPNPDGCVEREKDLYRKGHFTFSLVYKKEPDAEMTDESFYGNRLKTHFTGKDASYLR